MTTILLFVVLISSQGWDLLSSVDLVRKYDPMTGQEIDVPVFNEKIKKAEGSFITLEGYVIPLESAVDKKYFILSRFPYQSCFFCGAAGPETVVEVYTDTNSRYPMDKRIRVKGTLKLNSSDPLHLYYILENAKVQTIN